MWNKKGRYKEKKDIQMEIRRNLHINIWWIIYDILCVLHKSKDEEEVIKTLRL
jgi:hypothetical protein